MLVYGLGVLSMWAMRGVPFAEYEAIFIDRFGAITDPAMRGELEAILLLLYEDGATLMLILFARTALRSYGVLGMWRGRANAFHIYALAQLAGIFAPHLVLPWSYLGITGPLAAVALTALYGSLRKHNESVGA